MKKNEKNANESVMAATEDIGCNLPEICDVYVHMFDSDKDLPQAGTLESATGKSYGQASNTPDLETQLYIVRHFSAEAAQKIVTRFHLYACAEILLLKRGEKSLLDTYFRNNFLHNEVQEILVRLASVSEAGAEIFNLYIRRRSLCPAACWTLIRQKNDMLLASYLKLHRLGSMRLAYVAAADPIWCEYLFPQLVYPQDKLTFLLMLRSAKDVSKQKIKNFACNYDASPLLRELPKESCFELEGRLKPDEELVLTELPDKYLLEAYVCRYRLTPSTEKAIILQNNTELFNTYTHHSSLCREALHLLIREHKEELFTIYISTHSLSDEDRRFLEQHGTQRMIDEYLRRKKPLR